MSTPQRKIVRISSGLIAVALGIYLIIVPIQSIKSGTYSKYDILRLCGDLLGFLAIFIYGLNKFFIGSRNPYLKFAILGAIFYYLAIGIYDEKQGSYLTGSFELIIAVACLVFFKA